MYFRLRIAYLNFELQQTNDSLRARQEIILDKNFRWYFSRIMENIMTMMPVVILLGYVTNNISYSILFYLIYFGIFGTVEILARIFIFYKTGNVNRSKKMISDQPSLTNLFRNSFYMFIGSGTVGMLQFIAVSLFITLYGVNGHGVL